MLLHHPIEPFEGLAASVVTSNVVDTRAAFDLTLSWYTSSGTSSVLTYQVSNSTLAIGSVPNASWSAYTTFGWQGSGASTLEPPLGYRWARILRNPSNASYVVEMHQLVR